MNIAICDDNKQTTEYIQKVVTIYLAQTNIQNEIVAFHSGEDLLNSNMDWDIVFLDVEMGGISGIGVSKELRNRNPRVKIILVTAYEHYIDDAFDLKLCRFINKPVSKTRIVSCLSKAITEHLYDDCVIELKHNNVSTFLSISDVIYIETKDKKVFVHTYNESYLSQYSFSELFEKVKNKGFVQTHKSFLINCRYVVDFSPTYVKLICNDKDFEVYVSRRFAKECKQTIKSYLLFRDKGEKIYD